MAYSADTFVADEQPTTAKWNKLWSNDASFNDGTGIADNAILNRHLSSAIVKAAELQYGQVYRRQGGSSTDPSVVGNSNYNWSAENLLVQIGFSNATTAGDHTITFPVAFSEKPWAMVSAASARTNNAWARFKQESITTTQLVGVSLFNTGGSLVTTEGFTWIAIGKA